MEFINVTNVATDIYYETWRSSELVFTNNLILNTGINFNLRGSSTDVYNHQIVNSVLSGLYYIPGPQQRDIYFHDNLLKSSDLTCSVDPGAGANTGLADTTCANDGGSTATHISTLDFTSSLVGAVTSDSVNVYNNSGFADFDDMTEVNSFENIYRGWGKSASGLFDAGARDRCARLPCTNRLYR